MEREFLEKCLQNGMSTRDIEKISNLDHRTISYWITKYGLHNQSVYKKRKNFSLEKIDTKEKAYTLGYILGDAEINEKSYVNFGCAIADKCILDYISGIIDASVKTSYVMDKKNGRFPRARMSRKIKDITKFTGGKKKEDRHYPRIREDLEVYMILGFFDADGCITWGRRKDKNRIWQKISFTSQYKILEGVQKYLLNKLDIATSIHPKSGCKCFVLDFSKREDVIRFCEHIYKDKDFIILKRKYLKYNALRLELEENGEGGKCSDNTVPSLQSRKV